MNEKGQVIAIAQKIWDIGKLQRIAVYSYPDHKLYSIMIAVGFAVTPREHRRQNRKFDSILKTVHKLGYFLDNEEKHPPNVIEHSILRIIMGGEFGMWDNDPNLVKVFEVNSP